MLTSDLIRVKVKGRDIDPSYIEPDKKSLVEKATELVGLFESARDEGWRRDQLDDAVGAVVADRRDHKLLKGLAKLLLDRTDFAVESPLPPSELRLMVFRAAQQMGPVALQDGPLDRVTAQDVLAKVAAELDTTAEVIAEALYSDRKEEQRVTSAKLPEPEALLHRYNVALVQAVLLRASGMTVVLEKPTAPRVRQLMRHAKFQQLMWRAERQKHALIVHFDGPTSLFKQSSKYGLQLAAFFPALLLQEGPWRLHADVLWTKANHKKSLLVQHSQGLVSHYRDVGAYKSRIHEHFEGRYADANTDWQMEEALEPLDLGGRAVVMPDYRFERKGKVAHLEIIGFWRKDYLERRIAALREFGPGNLVLAVSKRLLGDKGKVPEFDGVVVPFAEVLSVKKVVEAVERVAR